MKKELTQLVPLRRERSTEEAQRITEVEIKITEYDETENNT
jgi:hypothetical protein